MKKGLIGFKKFLNFALAFLMVFTSIAWNGLSVEATISADEGNLILNGGFEERSDGDSNTFKHWNILVEQNYVESDIKHTGEYALKGYQQDSKIYQIIEVEAGQTYELTGYIYMVGRRAQVIVYGSPDAEAKTESTYVKMDFDIRDSKAPSGGMTIEDESGNPVSLPETEKWYKFSYTMTADETTNYVKVLFRGMSGKSYFDDISFCKVVAATGVSINDGAESVSVEAGKKVELTATVTPDNATDKTVTWSSNKTDVATVNETTGVVTGVSEGSATITATVGENVTDTITVNVTPAYVAQIKDGEKYETLQEAISKAEEGDTITLLGDVTLTGDDGEIEFSKITLDLNGKILTASSFTSFDGNVVDSSDDKTGVLDVDIFVPAATNTQMPIHNGTGYVFIDFNDIKKQEKDNTVANSGVFDLIFRPSFGETNNASLAALGDAAQVSFRIRLKWTDENGENEQTKDLYYSDDLVKQVYGDKKAFSITASGVSNYYNLTITPLVQSKLNDKIEWLGSTYTANQ
ncbi:MAG: Ig domain-containing protein [Lachnospiraceae bacterium]|nr:Ig domain-containing protein [Lachnospiraceae bacterium]